ncbi:APC family permease [Streptomyces sp. NPDC046862]|uniref:APC family permease n=1 Tax=Streptomyces sp. NPDC046862 TaxID=3154603 RepID=UPI00345272E6
MSPPSATPHRLKLVDAIAQSVGFLGPVFSASILLILLIEGASGKSAGPAAPLSVLIATIGVLGLGWIVAEYAKRIHSAGSLYSYISAGLGARIGAAAGVVYYAGMLMLGSSLGIYIGGYVYDTLQAEFHHGVLPVWGWQVLLLALVLAVAHVGVRVSIKAQMALALTSMLVLVGFFIYLIAHAGDANSVKAFSPSSSPDGWGGVLFGVLYGVLLFTGFETSANLAEETDNPGKNIPRAVLTSLLIAAAFYLLATYAQVAGFGLDLAKIQAALGSGETPLIFLGGPAGAGGAGSVAMRRILELVILLDMLAVYIGVAVAASRGIFSLARDGWIPRRLDKVSRRHGTPVNALVLMGAFLFIWILVSNVAAGPFRLGSAPDYFSTFIWTSTFGGFAMMVVYLLLSVSAVRGLRDAGSRVKVWIAAGVGTALTVSAVFGAIYKVSAPTVWAPYLALATLAVALVVMALVGRRRGDTNVSESQAPALVVD